MVKYVLALSVLFAAASFAVAAGPIIDDPRGSMLGLALVLAGLPVFWIWKRRVR